VTIVLASIGNAAAANAAASEPIAAASLYWPAWLLAGGALIALVAAVAILAGISGRLNAVPKARHKEFAETLCAHLWRHTRAILDSFATTLRGASSDVDAMRTDVRHLRELLSGPVMYVHQMNAHPLDAWPNYAMAGAFGDWAALVLSLNTQLSDLQSELTYPVTREAVNKDREQTLLNHYSVERSLMALHLEQVRERARRVCQESAAFLKASGHDDGGDCPCCGDTPHVHAHH
jgi:hypothetical protein